MQTGMATEFYRGGDHGGYDLLNMTFYRNRGAQ